MFCFPFHLFFKVSNQPFKNGCHLPCFEIFDNSAKTSFSPPVVVDRHTVPRVVQVVVGVAFVCVPVVVRVVNRVLRRVGRADLWSVVVCVGECHVGGGIWKKDKNFTKLLNCCQLPQRDILGTRHHHCHRHLLYTMTLVISTDIVSVLHQGEGGIGKSILDTQDPQEILRVEGILEGGGDGFPNNSQVLVKYEHSLIINFSTGYQDQEIIPCGQGRIDSAKINPSLLMMRE